MESIVVQSEPCIPVHDLHNSKWRVQSTLTIELLHLLFAASHIKLSFLTLVVDALQTSAMLTECGLDL